jgi:23S rRNA pseudouridine1911/1915/1917 synthase
MSDRSESFSVELSQPNLRFDTFLRERYPAVSRGVLQRLLEQGHITVDGKTVKPNHRPQAGQVVLVFFPEPTTAEAKPEDIPLSVLFEDADLLVVNKPPGIVVHPSLGHDEHTLVNALLHHCRGQLSGIGGVARPGIVHRLDKETSGCLLVAKNDETHNALAQQFAERSMSKLYQVLVCGVMRNDTGDIQADLARHPTHRKRMAVSPGDGRPSWTAFRVLERLRGATHVEATLHTGRTHQIRVHFQHIGYPVVGDSTYSVRPNKRLEDDTGTRFPRQMLHAWRITFTHPRTSEPVTCTAPVPDDFQRALVKLRGPAV